jgi:hypothetical protein
MKTIFYSWQSDLPPELNKHFIEEAIESAIDEINKEINNQTGQRTELLKLDRDTKGMPGSPPITDTILQKIDDCEAFIADLTFVAQTEKNPETGKVRAVSNPNVLIEYGYALKSKSNKKIISVMNTSFGKPSSDSMPFNLKHLRFPITYELGNDSGDELTQRVREALKHDLTSEIKLVLEMEGTSSDSLSIDVLADQASFYVLSGSKKIMLIPHLKISNIIERPVNVDIQQLEVDIEGDWHEAIRSDFSGETIKTTRATVHLANLGKDDRNFVRKHKSIRLNGFDSIEVSVAFELDIRGFENILKDKETLSIRGRAESLDGRIANFSGVITGKR